MTTVSVAIAASGDDVEVNKVTSTVYPPNTALVRAAATKTTTLVSKSFATTFSTRNTLLQWDTGAVLPDDCTVTAANLVCYVANRTANDGRNLVGEWYGWDGVSATDYTDTPGNDAFSTALSSLTIALEHSFALSTLSSISRTGITKMRLGVDGGEPAAANSVTIEPFDGATAGAIKPTLEITYTESAAPETLRPTTGGATTNFETYDHTKIDQDPNDATITDVGLSPVVDP